jgi:phosphoribosylamine--glycine ligase
MRHLVIGSGGREHAIGWKLIQQPECEVCFLPGNGGTAGIGTNVEVDPADLDAVIAYVRETKPDLVTVGPEDPLAMGIVDRIAELGIPVFGPTAECARIESSKVFAKVLMSRYSIPTAPFKIFDSATEAHAYIDKAGKPLVVKADGLARGKGAIVTRHRQDAHRAVETIMEEQTFGAAGDRIVVEERLSGEEASVIAVTDGERFLLFPPAQDHKPAFDGDRGPNTGGMGAYCPAPVVDRDMLDVIKESVFDRLLRGLRKEGLEYRGVIYAGLMIDSGKVHVIEFNARFGDPETQCTLPVVDVDIGDLMLGAAGGSIPKTGVLRSTRWAVSVVLASGGYPGSYEKGKPISGLDEAEGEEDVVVFHAGTTTDKDGGLVTSGGRVLAVTGIGRTLRSARRKAYTAARDIRFAGVRMRTDIGAKGLRRARMMGVI